VKPVAKLRVSHSTTSKSRGFAPERS